MICAGCQNPHAYQTHGYIGEGGHYVEGCDRCMQLSSSDASIPDVFWNGRPYFSESLGVEFTSRSQKARVMKERGVSELGNTKLGEKTWIEGSRGYRSKNFAHDRPMIRETLRKYRENPKRNG